MEVETVGPGVTETVRPPEQAAAVVPVAIPGQGAVAVISAPHQPLQTAWPGLEAVVVAAAVAVVLTPLALAVVSACLVRVPAEMVVLAPQQMALVALGVLGGEMRPRLVPLLQVTFTVQVTYPGPAFMAAAVAVLTTLLLNKLSVVLAQSASSGDPIGLSLVLTLETCNSHGY
jgi:hypothetical protein